MSKHTPGPWYCFEFQLTPTSDKEFGIAQAEGAPYTSGYSDVAKTISGEHLHIQEANARLIAAAPELLEALNELADYVDERSGDNECRPLENARATIAKAKGEE